MGSFIHVIASAAFTFLLITSCADKKVKPSGGTIENPTHILPKDESSPNEVNETKPHIEVDTSSMHEEKNEFNFQYDLSSPDQTFILPHVLIEISGLGYSSEENLIYCINDEKGYLYALNPDDGEIVNATKFGKKGDYEGIEVVNNDLIYIVKSNGDLVEFDRKLDEDIKIKTELHSSNDVEGMGFDSHQNMLLLACKGSPSLEKGNKSKAVKSVFGWSIEKQMLTEEPILSIRDEKLIHFYENNKPSASSSRQKNAKKRLRSFSPSGIAYNPMDQNYYLISSVGKLLVIVNRDSEIQHIEFLDDTYFAQPEGICFGKNNTMYISNEGRSLVAKLMRFEKN